MSQDKFLHVIFGSERNVVYSFGTCSLNVSHYVNRLGVSVTLLEQAKLELVWPWKNCPLYSCAVRVSRSFIDMFSSCLHRQLWRQHYIRPTVATCSFASFFIVFFAHCVSSTGCGWQAIFSSAMTSENRLLSQGFASAPVYCVMNV